MERVPASLSTEEDLVPSVVKTTDHPPEFAGGYFEHRPRYPFQLFDYLRSAFPHAVRVWDCGCGSGQASVPLAGHFPLVIASDRSPAQVAQAVAVSHPLTVVYLVAPVESGPLPAGSVDLVTVAQAIHWFHPLAAFYARVRQVLRPGGGIAVWGYGQPTIEGVDTHHVRDVWEAAARPPEVRLVEDGYQDLAFPFEQTDRRIFDMVERWSPDRFAGYARTLAHLAGPECAPRREEELEKLLRVWGSGERVVRWAVHAAVGRVGCKQ